MVATPDATHAPFSRTEWSVLGLALVVAAGFFVHQWWYQSFLYDAAEYAEMGRHIVEHGMFSRFMESQLRTYGYPGFLSLVIRTAAWVHLPALVVLFCTQLGLYCTAVVLFRRALSRWSLPAARVTFCGLMLNYYALLYTPECLTESLSLSAFVLLGAGWLEAYRRRGPLGLVAITSLVAGLAIQIRPANLPLTLTWLLGVGLIVARAGLPRRRVIALVMVAAISVAVPSLPQFAYNVTQFGRWTPLLAQNLGHWQQVWGIQYIKYATAMPPSQQAGIRYLNPWLPGTTLDINNPLVWYAAHPRRGILTLAVHTFNLTDQDLLFTYSRDLDPWYRIPLGFLNHATVALGLIGLARAGGRARTGSRALKDAMALVIVALAMGTAMLSLTAVEMRFGMVLLCGLFPAAAAALVSIVASKHGPTIVATAVYVALYVGGALRLSEWVRDQSPAIRAVVTSHTRPPAGAAPPAVPHVAQ